MMNATVRWPWQRASQQNNIELSWLGNTMLLALGALAFGPILKIFHWLTKPERPDTVVSMAWWGSLVLGFASVGIIVVYVATLGAILEFEFVELGLIVVVFVSYLAGVIYGLGQCPRPPPPASIVTDTRASR